MQPQSVPRTAHEARRVVKNRRPTTFEEICTCIMDPTNASVCCRQCVADNAHLTNHTDRKLSLTDTVAVRGIM